MALSMTGFGQGEVSLEGKRVTCSVKSVNNRYCDIQLRLPAAISPLESAIRGICRERIRRGKLDLQIRIEDSSDESTQVFCDFSLANAYKTALEELGEMLGRPCVIGVPDLVGYPGVLRSEDSNRDEAAWLPIVSAAVEKALDALFAMRREEGEVLSRDILDRCQRLEELRDAVARRAPQVVEDYRGRLKNRIEELLGDQQEQFYDEQRMAAEILLFADRAAIDEELVRLQSHIQAIRTTVDEDGPVGKKLDFLMQETNREVNTIGSKANDLEITQLVVELKNECEKIREQVQNLE